MMNINRLLKWFLVLTFVSSAFSSASGQLPSIPEYRLDLRIDYDTKKLYGTCEITISNRTEEPIKTIPVMLYRLLTIKNVEDENNVRLSFDTKIISISGWEQIQVNFT